MDREARRGRLRRWGAILAALIRAGRAWIRRALLRHRLARRAATAIFNKEDRKGADVFCSKNRSPPRQNKRALPKKPPPRPAASADCVAEGNQRNSSAKGPAMQEDAVTATRCATLVDSKNQESLARPGLAAPSTEATQGGRRVQPAQRGKTAKDAATPSSRGVLTKVGHQSARKAKDSRADARPVPGAQKVAKSSIQAELFEEGYGIDILFAEEAGDPERLAHSSYGRDARRYKGYTLCLTCYLKGKVTKIRDHEEMKSHCLSAHQRQGTKCKKKGCIARGNDKREIGLHQDVCHNI